MKIREEIFPIQNADNNDNKKNNHHNEKRRKNDSTFVSSSFESKGMEIGSVPTDNRGRIIMNGLRLRVNDNPGLSVEDVST